MLETVTLTGADDSVDPAELIALSQEFPFCEWGVLRGTILGRPRFPTDEWVGRYAAETARIGLKPVQTAVHLCGKPARTVLAGDAGAAIDLIGPYADFARRIQLNGFGAFDTRLESIVDAFPAVEFILQCRTLEQHRDTIGRLRLSQTLQTCLFDPSGGRGQRPDRFQELDCWGARGFAGGIGPGNVVDVLCAMSDQTQTDPFWIDMESSLRSERDTFDLSLCRRVLVQCRQFVPVDRGGTAKRPWPAGGENHDC